MDTHHIISAEAVKHSELGENLVNKGYDIWSAPAILDTELRNFPYLKLFVFY